MADQTLTPEQQREPFVFPPTVGGPAMHFSFQHRHDGQTPCVACELHHRENELVALRAEVRTAREHAITEAAQAVRDERINDEDDSDRWYYNAVIEDAAEAVEALGGRQPQEQPLLDLDHVIATARRSALEEVVTLIKRFHAGTVPRNETPSERSEVETIQATLRVLLGETELLRDRTPEPTP